MVGYSAVISKSAIPLGIGSILGLAVTSAAQAGLETVPIAIVPTINLVAIISGAIAMGMLINRVKQLERRMNKVQARVFHEDDEGGS